MEKLKPLTVTLPGAVWAKIDEAARGQYLSRSAIVRRLLIEELDRREQPATTAGNEVSA